MRSIIALLAAVILVTGCKKAEPRPTPAPAASVSAGSAGSGSGSGSGSRCLAACRNFFVLAFWANWDPRIDAAPEAERQALRHQKQLELEQRFSAGVDQCLGSCRAANNTDQVECMANAKTFAEAEVCAATEEDARQGGSARDRATSP